MVQMSGRRAVLNMTPIILSNNSQKFISAKNLIFIMFDLQMEI